MEEPLPHSPATDSAIRAGDSGSPPARESGDEDGGLDGTAFPVSSIPAAKVASVPQRSPLRYPGGKTWLIPHVHNLRPLVVPLCIAPRDDTGLLRTTQ